MKSHRLTLGIALAAALALPASASAHGKPTPNSVRSHISSANAALEQVSALVAANDNAAAAVEAARNRVQTNRANREARKLHNVGDRATALRRVAQQHDANLRTFTDLVGEAAPEMQVDIATAIVGSLTGRERALETLTKLLPALPAQALKGIAKAITTLSSRGPVDVDQLVSAAKTGGISPDAQSLMQTAIGMAGVEIASGMDRLTGLAGMLPAQAQGPVQAAMDRVKGILQGLLSGRAPSPSTGTPSGRPIPAGLLGLIGNLPILSGLLSPGSPNGS